MTLDEIIKGYQDLLILQYWDKPKARATIETIIRGLINAGVEIQKIPEYFDIDKAEGKQLDVLGRIIGIRRIVINGIPKLFFGFNGASVAQGFGMAVFKTNESYAYSPLQLEDYQYRFFIKAKIAKNFFNGAMSGANGLLELLSFIFGDKIYAVDTNNMIIRFYIRQGIDQTLFRYILEDDLIPKPAGVRIDFVGLLQETSFGFNGNPNVKGFGMAPFAILFRGEING
jgi:hypothetical protein